MIVIIERLLTSLKQHFPSITGDRSVLTSTVAMSYQCFLHIYETRRVFSQMSASEAYAQSVLLGLRERESLIVLGKSQAVAYRSELFLTLAMISI